MSGRAVLLVARQELRIRLRTGRWRWLLAAWVVVVGVFTLLTDLALRASNDTIYEGATEPPSIGPALFTVLVLVVFGLIMVVSPALTAQSVNGDRERGTLAVLQVTRLRPAEIAVGKLLAGWGVGVGALLLTLPFAVWPVVYGGVGAWRIPVVYLVMIVLLGVVCAVSQALSSLVVRGVTSTMLAYATVFALCVGTLILYGLMGAAFTQERTVVLDEGDGGTFTYVERSPSENIWWVLAPNPFVVLIDASPTAPERPRDQGDVAYDQDPLKDLHGAIRSTRVGPGVDRRDAPAVWPYGLAANLLLGVGSVLVTIRRLRAPVAALPRGVRIA
ncbi:ABC transporter permease [Luedemannella helvata]|uniref:ABC transporter permease n=1 Tax=Luedemannella helvata TaxID=349315 RepID=A0ABN2KLT6_9ACTN